MLPTMRTILQAAMLVAVLVAMATSPVAAQQFQQLQPLQSSSQRELLLLVQDIQVRRLSVHTLAPRPATVLYSECFSTLEPTSAAAAARLPAGRPAGAAVPSAAGDPGAAGGVC